MNARVFAIKTEGYDDEAIAVSLPSDLFRQILPGDTVVLKPNWVRESHMTKSDEWDYVITHPSVITATLSRVCDILAPGGRITIADAPQTDSSFANILAHYPVEKWQNIAGKKGINLEIIDLRDDEWIQKKDVVVSRKKLAGDPRGKTEVNLLDGHSEFFGHRKSPRGYYGADYNIQETNEAHDGHNNRYRLSRSVIEADVFINLPKLKTHKKAGITCCLKNLVGINTYKNFLPHHAEGSPAESGDQFPENSLQSRIEGPVLAFVKQKFLQKPAIARLLRPLSTTARSVFGETEHIVRSGNWFGNDTLWRMTLDLNKAFFYANPDGTMREAIQVNAKKYIGIVDAVLAGEGNGPLSPNPHPMGYILAGTNPVAIDAVCARMMGFDPMKIPTIRQAFEIKKYPISDFSLSDIIAIVDDHKWHLDEIPESMIQKFEPQHAWKNHIEY
jgi:uncharacterized protein (DUF362 family)